MITSDVSHIPGLTTAQVELFDYLLAEAGLVFDASERIPRRPPTVEALPLSFAQQRLWFLDQLVPNNPFYNIADCFRLHGPLDTEALTHSLNTLMERHEALRTVFTTQAGEPVQVVLPPQLAPLTLVSLRPGPEADRVAEAIRLANAETRRPFDLSTGPLLRFTLLRFTPTEHWLLMVVHHIIFDDWSTAVFQNELVTLYRAYAAGQPASLPALPIQYADYALWERQWLRTERLEAQLSYWKRQLGGLPVLELATDHPRPAVQTYTGATETLTLPTEITTALRALSQQAEVTLFMVLVASFKTLLHRYTGQVDIPLGIPVANRQPYEVEKLLGFFVNTLVLRSDFSDNPTFWAVLQRVRETTLEAQANQNLPFDRLVEELHLKRTLSHAPLFQVAFGFENTPDPVAVTPDLTLDLWEPAELSVGAAKFDLTLFLADNQKDLTATLEYNTDLFDRTTIVRMLGHWQNLLTSATANPHQSVAALSILSPAEREQTVYTWNARQGEYPKTQTLVEHFETHAARAPTALAVCYADQTLTYQELNNQANQLAHYLRANGVTRGALVGVCVARGPGVVLGLLAALKAGAAYVPLDPAYPQERLNYMLEEAQVAWLLTQAEMLPRLEGYVGRVLCLDADWPQVAPHPSANPPSSNTINDLAYVIYTSGSTGRPKGVGCEHTGVLNLLADCTARQPILPGDGCSLWTSTSFDVSIYEIFSALTAGGTLYLPPEDARAEAERFSVWLAENRIASAYIPPFFLNDFAAWVANYPGQMALRRLLVGVEPIPESLLVTIAARIPGLKIINGYGPTETSICSTLYSIGPSAPPGRNTPIGRPVQNMTIYLLDQFMQPVPIGVAGELYIGGTGIAWGYLNRPRITTEKFLPDPFSTAPGARMYRTGDLARFLPDGNIEFLGRADQQVKIRGFRIELGEIEKVLEEHLAVQAAVVLARQDRPGDKRLVAYVVLKRTYTLTNIELRTFAQKKLPDYMVPLAFIFLDHFPLTPNGKLNQRALPMPDWAGLDQSEAYVPPQTPTEELLASIWAEVLHLERVGAQNNFFELGGHSLLATQIISRIRGVFQVELPLRQLFETPTIATLGKAIEANHQTAPTGESQPHRIGRTGPLALSFAQQRLWFLDQLEPNSAFYNIPVVLRLHGRLDFLVLQHSLEALIHRHEILRTTFPIASGQPQQHIAPPTPFVLPRIDLRTYAATERPAVAHQLAVAEARQPFDLVQGPLLRAKLLQVENEENWLLLTFHHIIADGWSMNVLVQELVAFYEAFYVGRTPTLPELTIQYADFAHWQRRWLQGERLEEQLDYWKEQLADAPARLELPTDHPRPAVQTYTGATLKFTLPNELATALKTFARQTNVTLFMLFLSAYYVLLYRYTGQADLVVGSPIAGRNVDEIEELIGLFVNTLALRVNLKDKPSFKDLLDRVRDLIIDAYTHQDIPFEKLVEELRPERNLSHTPLFQVMFALNSSTEAPVSMPDLRLDPLEVTNLDVAKFDLTLTVEELPQHMVCEFEYNTDLFEATTIERLMGHWQELLTNLLAMPDTSVANLLLLPENERQQLQAWNNTQAPYPQEKCLAELFEAQVQRTPTATALVFGTQTFTYQALNRRANQVARRLQALGIGPDQPVGLFIERIPEMAVGVLGILKAGGAYVPLDPTYPAERLAFMLADTRATIVLTQRSLVPHVPNANVQVIVLDEGWPEPTVAEDAPVPCAATAENLAYIIFTAGSTGQPKGVGVVQRNVVNHALFTIREFGLHSQDRVLQFASISFDIAVEELFPTWFVGATLVLRTEDMLASAQHFLEVVAQQQLSVLDLPTAYWHDWTKDLTLLKAKLPATLRLVVVGGEKAAPATLDAWQTLAGTAVRWLNTYGPTETTVTATVFDPHKNTHFSFKNSEIPIGRPIDNAACYLLDVQLELVPPGAIGELYIGGAGVARGYLNRPDLTAAKFIPNPFSTAPGQRLYATGDLARYLPDGNLQFLDRRDGQVKIRGFRIELGEIETALGRHPQVRTAVVIAHASARGHQELAAYVVPQPGEALTRQSLLQHLKTALPHYMVPAVVMFLDTLPMTPSGKINRRALPAPVNVEDEEGGVVPRTPTEEALAQIWREVLALPEVSVLSNFFELGGHSLLATQIMSRVRHTLQVELPLRTLFEAPTIAMLAAAIESSHTVRADAEVQLRPTARAETPALSFAQQRLWFLDQLEPGLAFYNIPVLLRLTGQLNFIALQRSLEALLHRHEILRTTFPAAAGQPYQRIAPPAPFVLTVTDLRPHPATEREAMAHQLTQAEARQPFDLEQGPLLRLKLIQLETDHHWLMLTFHHIIFDGWSTNVLVQELGAFYKAFQRGHTPVLPELAVQYADFAHWQRQWLQGLRLEEQLAYWKRQLSDAPALLELPTDHPRPPVQTYHGATYHFTLPAALTAELKALSQRESVTLFMTLLAAFQTLLYRYTGQSDIAVGAPVAGRHYAETENLIGFFVNTLVLRADLSRNPAFNQFLQQVRENLLEANAHQDVPFEKLVEELKPERNLSYPPLFQVLFTLAAVTNTPQELLDLTVSAPEMVWIGAAKFDLSLEVEETPAGLVSGFEYNTDLFEASTIERLAQHWQTLLESVCATPAQPVATLPILTTPESTQLLTTWNTAQTVSPFASSMAGAFEAQVARTPHAIALVCEQEALTYATLNARANQLAHYLRTLGVGPEVLVAVCLERRIELIVALLAILKAGGAYVPLDPMYPADRVTFMLADTQAPVVITQTSLVPRLPTSNAQVVCVDTLADTLPAQATNLPWSGHIEQIAYIIYTSGSTGRPKGVTITHRSALVFFTWAQQVFTPAELTGVLAATSVCFDLSVFEIFVPLSMGGKIILVENALALPKTAARDQVTLVNTVPSAMLALVNQNEVPPQVQTVNLAGEPLKNRLAQALYQLGTVQRVNNLYGPSEDTTYSTWVTVPAGSANEPTIGRPIANTEAYILDPLGQPVPIGVRGEVFLGGEGLARGYLNRPDLTAEKFVPDPFSGRLGGRLYRTGDVARYLPNGEMEFLGRIDYQVKIRGFRIEIGEVEATLSQHPDVREVAVMARENERGEKALVAYLAPQPGQQLTVGALRKHLTRSLPDYMVPAAFVMLEALPLTPSGKIDRRALPAPQSLETAQDLVSPRTPIEEALAEIWRTVLALPELSVHSNFFELGGHSLLATQIMSRVRNSLQVELPLRTLFEAPTVAELAHQVEQAQRAQQDGAPLVLGPMPRPGMLPLSFAQQRLWFLDQLEPANPLYNIPLILRLTGALNLALLEQSLKEIARRHESLRTHFVLVDREPIQVVQAEPALPLQQLDLETLPAATREAEAQRLLDEESHQPISLTQGPLWRLVLVRLNAESHLLLIVIHHIISDGWSMGVFLRELTALYEAYGLGRSSPLPELPLQYPDFALWQRQWLRGQALEAQLAYWRKQLAGSPSLLELPTDRPRPAVQTYHGAACTRTLSPSLSQALKTLCQQTGTTLFMTLLATFQLLLHRYAGQEDVLVGVPIANRHREEIESLIGFFINTLVIRANFSGVVTFKELLMQVREVALGAYAHQDLPFEKLVEELQPERSLSHNPLFQVFFNLFTFEEGHHELPDLTLDVTSTEEAWSKFDLTLYVADQAPGISLELVYNADLFNAERMTTMLAQLQYLCEQITAQPQISLNQLSLVPPPLAAQLPNPAQPLPPVWLGAVHTHFAQQAQRTPTQVAVLDEQTIWSYQLLEERSNQLAHYLRAQGVPAQAPVAIYGHRSAALVWAMLGVLKAGAAFVILDPAYPTPRLLERVQVAKPQAWLQLAAAGQVPPALQQLMADIVPTDRRVTLPAAAEAAPAWLASYPTEALNLTVEPDDVAYLAFTSGTTGQAKGIVGTHRPLAHFIQWHIATFGLQPTDRFSLLSGLAHDPLLRDIFTPLWLGATLCIPQPDRIEFPGQLAAWLHATAATVTHLTPAMAQVILESDVLTFPTWRYAFFGGDKLTQYDVNRLCQVAPALQCVNFYGATETPQAMGYHRIEPSAAPIGTELARDLIPVGRGIEGVQLLVLNAAQGLAGIGELGEIYIRTPYLAQGYLGDATLTQERFIANPFSAQPGDRLYKTGDLGRYLPDGTVTHAGRADRQLKIRGFRIEPGEIEAALSQHPAVRESAVTVRPDPGGEKRLVAYLTLRAAALPMAEVRDHLSASLPSYMLPAAFVTLEALPLTPNGKIDWRALPEPAWEGQLSDRGYAAPRTPAETLLAEIWSQVLRRQHIGIHHNFFELGGHSLLATQIMARVRNLLQVELPLRALFEAPTVATLALKVEAARQAQNPYTRPPLRPTPRTGPLPLSFSQQRLWFLDQFEPNSASYNMAFGLRFAGPLDVSLLNQSLAYLAQRHETLRTTFVATEGTPQQTIAPTPTWELTLRDLSAMPLAKRERTARHLASANAEQPFDLAAGPLLRVLVLRLSAHEHWFLLTIHHIIADAWSLEGFIRELGLCYLAYQGGTTPILAPLPVQYADYAVWQREWLQGAVLAEQLAYWKTQLAGAPPLLELPTDRPRPAVQTTTGARHWFTVSTAVTQALRALSQQTGATLFMALLATFQTLLYRYSGQTDVVVGSPIAGRTQAELEHLVGFFINSLVLRTNLGGNPSFQELVGRVREVTLGAYAHQDVPFEKLVEELGVPRNMSYSPLFQVVLVLLNVPEEADQQWGELTLQPLSLERANTGFDITLTLAEEADGSLWARLEYNRDLFEAATIERLSEHFCLLLETFAAQPTRRLLDVPLLTAAERYQLLNEWNTPSRLPADAACFPELFAAQAARTPEAVALVYEQQTLSYQALDARANQLAHHLQTLGVGPETLVAVCMERSAEVMVALLGVHKAGGAFVPIDPTYPPERLAFMLEDSSARILLTQQRLLARLPAHSAQVLCLDAAAEIFATQPTTHPPTIITPTQLAYIIYTSGSTGRPKGAMITHRGLINYLAWGVQSYQVAEGMGAPVHSSLAFDLTVTSLFMPLLVGKPVVMFREDQGGEALSAALPAGANYSLLKLTPAHLEVINQQLAPDVAERCARVLIVGGEALWGSAVRFWQTHAPSMRIINEYGPTETVVGCCVYEVPANIAPSASIPIGYPIANTQLYVLDANFWPVPVGVIGELYIGGEGVGRGYWQRPSLTAEKFVPDPFSRTPGARLYRTGDLARYQPNGCLEYLGRIDNQVKVRGYRIELGEIEAAVRQYPSVQEAVVLAREDQPGNKYLAAYMVPQADTPLEVSALRTFLREHLPEYMVPVAFTVMEVLPLTPNGKVDRRALPQPEWAKQLSDQTFVAPRTPTEELLANIWSQVLRHERLSIHHNFFELGGHSLLATQVMARIQKVLRVTLPLRTLFETPTIATLAERVEQARLVQQVEALPPLQANARPEFLPLSFTQERLWFLDQFEPDASIYNIPLGLRLTGPLDLRALEYSLTTLGQRHETLRTTFQATDGKPYQLIAPTASWQLEVQDLSALPPAEREERLNTISTAEGMQPFNLATGPLVRAKLLRLTDQDHCLLLTLHHIISDGWSTETLIRELGQLYRAQVAEAPLTLPELPVQYADFAVWQRSWLQGALLEQQLAYWRQHLAGAPALLELPTDRPRPAAQTFQGGRHWFTVPQPLTKAIKALSQQAETTLFMTLLAAFQTLLHRYSGQTQLVIGSPIAGRTQVELENLIGFFINTLVFHTDLSGNPSFKELLARVREVTLGAYAHQDVPFEKLVEALAVERNLSYTPLFQVMFVLQNVPEAEMRWGDLTLQALAVERTIAKFDLTLVMAEEVDGLTGYWEYNSDLFDASTIERMAANFQVLLAGLVNQPQQTIATLPLITTIEQQQLLTEWNRVQPAVAVPPTACLQHLFEAQVARTPQARAVTYKGQHLTYAELNTRANQLAHHLRTLGAGPDKVVGLCMERSLDLMVGILGILKAGAAYLPLDPAYPQNRLAFMVADAQVTAVLTQTAFTNLLPTGDVPVINVEADWPTIAKQPTTDPTSWTTPDNLAYIIYTSGSTGKPKGVMIYHANVVRLMRETDPWYHFNERDVWTLFHSYAFDFSVWEIWGALLYGGRLVVVPFEVSRSPDEFYQLLASEQVTVLNQTPSAFKQLITAEGALPAPAALALRYVIFGGEALEPRSLQPWYERHGDTQPTLVNMYGITETTVHVTYRPLTLADVEGAGSPVGGPIPDLQVYVLDTHLNLVPIGVPGEMYVGGAGSARGYLNRPDLSAERFVPDPFSPTPGARLYKTGDRARYTANGQLEFLGRADNQVKIRGFRIELGEIEAALSRHPDIRETVVLVREDTPGDKRLVAYLVAKAEAPNLNELRNFLQKTLPSYMLPAAFVFMASFPQTTNGKINRKALPAPTQERPELEKHFVPPQTPIEVAVTMIWRQVLRVENIGLHDNFFDLGGHSLLATQLLSRLRETFRTNITLRDLFEAPTVANLVNRLIAKEATPGQTEKIALLLKRLAQMSPEEVKKALAATRGKAPATS